MGFILLFLKIPELFFLLFYIICMECRIISEMPFPKYATFYFIMHLCYLDTENVILEG